MGRSNWLEVSFHIENLLLFDFLFGLSLLLLMMVHQLPDKLLMAAAFLFVIGVINCIRLAYIKFVTLPRAVRMRFEFTDEEIAWDGSITLAEELHLLAPGHERVGIFPSWKCEVGVPASLLADLVLAEVVDIVPMLRKNGTARSTYPLDYEIKRNPDLSTSNSMHEVDPIALRVLDRFLSDSMKMKKSIRNWIEMCKDGKISLNDGLLCRLVQRGELQEIEPKRECIFTVPSFHLTPKGKIHSKIGIVQEFLRNGTKPTMTPRNHFLLYLACFGGVGIAWKPRKERTLSLERAANIKADLPTPIKIIAEAIFALRREDSIPIVGA
ncbi:MAG: GPP34 family phosphoprotein [Candidatus Sigynarchaeota archaeon]